MKSLDIRLPTGVFTRSVGRCLALLLMLLCPLSAAAADKVRLQLKWQHQFQFAGYYAAQAQGYYRAAGLEVEIIPSQPGEDSVQQVLQGRAEFGVGSTELLLLREQGAPVVVLAVIFQHSPLALMTLQRSGPQSIHDLAGRKLMIEPGSSELYAYLNKEGISSDKFTLLPHGFQAKDLLAGNVDALSTYVTDEPFELHQAGQQYLLYSPRSVGIDFYGDNLFTTESQLTQKPEMVGAFREASLKGWAYAMQHPEELAQLIYSRYSQRHSLEHLRFEADQMVPLLQTALVEIGHMNPGRWQHIAETYAELGMMKPAFNLKGFLYDPNPPPPDLSWLYGFMGVATLVIAVVSALAMIIYRTNSRLRQEAAEHKQAEQALRESEGRYRTLFEQANDAIWILDLAGDRTGRILLANAAAAKMYGYSVAELEKMRITDLDVPESVSKAPERFDTIRKGESISGETLHVRKDGIVFPLEFSATPVEFEGRSCVLAFSRDITERKQAEVYRELSREVLQILNEPGDLPDSIQRVLAALKMRTGFDAVGLRLTDGEDFPYVVQEGFSGDFLRTENTLLERGANGEVCRDKDGKVRLECTCGLVISGQTPAAHPLFTQGGSFWTNDSFPLLDLPSDQDPRLHPRNQCMVHGYASMALVPIRNKDGIVGLIHINDRRKGCFTLATVECLEEIASHIGEALMRKRAEEVRDEALSRLQKIASRVPGLVYEYRLRPDGSSCLPFASEAIRELFRVSPEEVREDASKLFANLHPDDYDGIFASIRESARNLTLWHHEYRVKFDDGTERWLLGNALPQREADGSTLWHGFITDITERKQAEAELRETNRQLEAATARANDMAVQAELATRVKSEFLANMSHEIRTPMTAILGYADLLLEEHVGPAAQEHVAVIKRSGEQLLGLINDILDLAKVEAGKLQIEPIRCSPGELVAEIVSFMRVRAAEKFLVLTTELGDPLPETVLTDPLRLRQVLINLLSNAIKFTDQGEIRLTVRLSSDDGPPRLCFDVTDPGIGMTAEQVGQLFQPFTQVDSSSTRKFGGTGLGLCISKHLAEALGGDLEVRSQPGRGSTFTLTIEPGPLDGIRLLHGGERAALQPPPCAAPAAAGPSVLHVRILLAEDCLVTQQVLALLLGRAGAEVTLAENGQLAVAAAWAAHEAGQPFDVILMDMSMPVLDGFEATRQLRQRGYTASIIALTAYAMTEDRRKCLAAGCDDYATKPIDRQTLLATIASRATRGCTHDEAPAASPPASASRLPTAIHSELDLADDPKMGELVAFFVRGMPDRIQAIEAQAQSRDWHALEQSAHRLRGAAGVCGFDTFMASARQLETAVQEAQSEERMLAAVAELVSLSRHVHAGIAPTPDFEVAHFEEK